MTHPLERFLRETDTDASHFAALVGVSPDALARVIAREEALTPQLARRVVEATDGAVSFDDLVGPTLADLGAANRGALDLDRPLLEACLAEALTSLGTETVDAARLKAPAAEAISATYAALYAVSTRQGPSRLLQALRPVLAEILSEALSNRRDPDPTAIDRAAKRACEAYLAQAAPRPASR